MLINDDTKGQSGAKERDQLDAMLDVGSEFMTYSDETSTIQRSGDFVRITMDSAAETKPRFLLLHETSDVYRVDGETMTVLDDGEFYGLPATAKLRQRTRLMLSQTDQDTGADTEFRPLRSALDLVRMPRYTQFHTPPFARRLYGMHDSNYTAIGGKRRLFPQPDGKTLVVRDVVERGGRYYYGQGKASANRVRAPRVSRIEVLELDERGKLGKAPVFSFPVHSGLGVDAAGKTLQAGPFASDASLPVADDLYVYGAAAGAMWGDALSLTESNATPLGGDAGDTFAFCEPAVAPKPGAGAGTYVSMIAVYAADDDVHDPQSSGPYRLTCKRTTPAGDTVTSKITFQTLAAYPNHYLAARGITLLRTSPTNALLRVIVHVMQSGVPGSLSSLAGDVLFFWTQDNGATWTYQPVVAGFPVHTYGALLVRDATSVLVLGSPSSYPATVPVWQITPTGFSAVTTIPYATFAAGLMDPASGVRVPYLAFGFGGAVYRKTPEGTKKRLWMQFDPQWIYKDGLSYVLDYPGSRPLILVSDDNGATWARRLLPTKWAFLAGFVVSVDGSTLAVPIYAARKEHGKPVRVTVYLSRDGGETWKPTRASGSMPMETYADGDILIGEDIIGSTPSTQRKSQDVANCWLEYNRGELHPMQVLRDSKGNFARSNPARPWMVDTTVKEPTYG